MIPSKRTEKEMLRSNEGSKAGAAGNRPNPRIKMMAVLAVGFIVLMAFVVAASISNRANYYLRAESGAVEIWQGRFAPMGKERILILPGAQPPATVKDIYSNAEINAIAFNYYIDRADILLDAPDMPDFNGIRLYLKMALSCDVTDEMRQAAFTRLDTIDMMVYLYKADVAASKGTLADFGMALEYMGKAAALNLDAAQSDLVSKKIKSIEELMAALQDKHVDLPEMPATAPPIDRERAQTERGSAEK